MLSSKYEKIPAIITIEEPRMIGHVILSLNIRTPIIPARPSEIGKWLNNGCFSELECFDKYEMTNDAQNT